MSIISLAELASSIIILCLALLIFRRNPYDNFYKLFSAALTVLFAAIFCEYRISISQVLAEARILSKFADVFWLFTTALLLHAVLHFQSSPALAKRSNLFLIYLPQIILSIITLSTDITYVNFIDTAMGIFYVHNYYYFVLVFVNMVYLSAIIFLCFRTWRLSENALIKKQAYFIGLLFSFPLLVGTGILILPAFFRLASPSLISLSCAIAAVLGAVVEQRYHLFPKYPEMTGENIFKFLPDILIVTDLGSRVSLVSRSFLQLSGLGSAEELIGKPLSEVIKDKGVAGFLYISVIRENRRIRDCPLVIGEKIFSLNTAPIFDNTRDKIGMVTIGRDVTERKRNESELKRNTEALGANLLEIDRLNRAFTQRELAMSRLKDEIKGLKAKLHE